MAARGIAQAARNAPHAQLAHSLAQHCGCRARAEPLEDGERLGAVPLRYRSSRAGWPARRHTRVPATSALRRASRRRFPARKAGAISVGVLRERLHPVAAIPRARLASADRGAVRASSYAGCTALDHCVPIAGQPRGLGADCRDPADALQVGLWARQRARFCERRSRSRDHRAGGAGAREPPATGMRVMGVVRGWRNTASTSSLALSQSLCSKRMRARPAIM